ncbi:MAG: Ulp1 family isopeptidase [Chlamydiales bacterium]
MKETTYSLSFRITMIVLAVISVIAGMGLFKIPLGMPGEILLSITGGLLFITGLLIKCVSTRKNHLEKLDCEKKTKSLNKNSESRERESHNQSYLSNVDIFSHLVSLSEDFPNKISLIDYELNEKILNDMHKTVEEGFTIKSLLNKINSQLDPSNPLDVPIFILLKNHWVLVYFDKKHRSFEYYDSKGKYGKFHEIIERELIGFMDTTFKISCTFTPKITWELQKDGYQCGPWTLYFLEQKLSNSQFEVNALRRKNQGEISSLIRQYRQKIEDVLAQIEDNKNKTIEDYQKVYASEEEGYKAFENKWRELSRIEGYRHLIHNKFPNPKFSST